ncbi:MAG: cysteine-rich CWC family protein [Mariprofundaceae bacterium]
MFSTTQRWPSVTSWRRKIAFRSWRNRNVSDLCLTVIDVKRCPLCGELNQCVMAVQNPDEKQHCWCRSENIPQALLNRIPHEARLRACICRKCLQNEAEQSGTE